MYTERVRALANDIAGKTDWVKIVNGAIEDVAQAIKMNQKGGEDKPVVPLEEKTFFYSLIANSVNYCYWYGWHTIRPNGASSSAMHDFLRQSFHEEWSTGHFSGVYNVIDRFYTKMADAGFPLMEERYRHLQDINQDLNGAYAFFSRMKPVMGALMTVSIFLSAMVTLPFSRRSNCSSAIL